MKRLAAAVILGAATLVVAGCGGSHRHHVNGSSPAPVQRKGDLGPVLGGQVQVVAYPSGNVRICPNYAIAYDLGLPRPPLCANGLRAVGVDTSALTNHAQGHPQRWGFLYLVGDYNRGVFSVKLQRLRGPATQPEGTTSFGKPPCPTPLGGWVVRFRTEAQQHSLDHYSKLSGHHDLVDIAFFDHDSVLTVASADPARTRAVLAPYWPRQLCVVKARYSRATLIATGKRLERLMTSPQSAAYGWITGAGGTGVRDDGQPTTSVEVLLETPQLRELIRRQPPGLVVVQAALHPVGRD
jgi:hypothetical protein